MTYHETNLLEKLEILYKTDIHSYSGICKCNGKLLYNIKNCRVVCLDYDASAGGFNQMPQFFDNLYKACDL